MTTRGSNSINCGVTRPPDFGIITLASLTIHRTRRTAHGTRHTAHSLLGSARLWLENRNSQSTAVDLAALDLDGASKVQAANLVHKRSIGFGPRV